MPAQTEAPLTPIELQQVQKKAKAHRHHMHLNQAPIGFAFNSEPL